MKTPFRLAIISLGCAKNLADTEAIVGQIHDLEIIPLREAKIVLLNTCGFLKTARSEVFQTLAELKDKKVILLGCMAKLFNEDAFNKYHQLYAILSSANYARINEILAQVANNNKIYAVSMEPTIFEPMNKKALLTSKSYAYVKIAEGCSNQCSYCLIPNLKGKYRSRKMKEILAEIKSLIKLGIKEIILVAQDCGFYGVDLYKKRCLTYLLRQIVVIPGEFWVRVLYVYPERINNGLLEVISKNEKICKYLDIPLQHGDPEILAKMNRVSNLDQIYEKISEIRKLMPDITLRTSLIVGFPSETEENFQNLLKFVEKINFDHIGVFKYSREKNTHAYLLKPQISEKIKKEREKKVMLLQQKISLAKNKELVGRDFKTLIERFDAAKNIYIGRSQKFAPEVDGQIFIKSKQKLILNQFYQVKITKAGVYDLFGKIK